MKSFWSNNLSIQILPAIKKTARLNEAVFKYQIIRN